MKISHIDYTPSSIISNNEPMEECTIKIKGTQSELKELADRATLAYLNQVDISRIIYSGNSEGQDQNPPSNEVPPEVNPSNGNY